MPVRKIVPGPLTLRIMLRVWSSMNSTRTWVTPPREPVQSIISFYFSGVDSKYIRFWGEGKIIPVLPRTRVTRTSLTGCLAESIFAIWKCWVWCGGFSVSKEDALDEDFVVRRVLKVCASCEKSGSCSHLRTLSRRFRYDPVLFGRIMRRN